jgi:hypothetical protein
MSRAMSPSLVLALTVLVAPLAARSPHPTPPSSAGVDLVVDGVPRPQYPHAGRVYVEAVKGREYAIRLRNPYPVRVAVALSVDGLNTIDARETTAADARKWVLGAFETVTIPGWQTSLDDARRFEFTTEARSYGAALGRTANLGVISAVFFRERAPIALIAPRQGAARGQADRRPAPAAPSAAGAAAAADAVREEEYAATGMGRRNAHAVTEVAIQLENVPAHRVDLRYEFRPQLIALGALPTAPPDDPHARRERARGFAPGFSPEPRRR